MQWKRIENRRVKKGRLVNKRPKGGFEAVLLLLKQAMTNISQTAKY